MRTEVGGHLTIVERRILEEAKDGALLSDPVEIKAAHRLHTAGLLPEPKRQRFGVWVAIDDEDV